MAFKPITRKSTVALVSLEDPAIDIEASDVKGFTGDMMTDPPTFGPMFTDPAKWPEYIKTKEGEELTKFFVGVIPSDELNRLEDKHHHSVRCLNWECFCAALVGIDGGLVPERVDTKDATSKISRAWIEKTFAGPLRNVAIEIGRMAYRWQGLSEDDARP